MQTANWWWQEWLNIGILSGRANFVLLEEFHRGDINTNFNMAIVLVDTLLVL